LLGYIDFK